MSPAPRSAGQSPSIGHIRRRRSVSGVTSRWGDTTEWQYWVIEFLKRYEMERGYQRRPVGMTMHYPVADPAKVNDPLFDGPADWVSPGSSGSPADEQKPGGDWLADPAPSDGRKVVISDTDHYSPFRADPLWAWC
jgi:hypothetical protein